MSVQSSDERNVSFRSFRGGGLRSVVFQTLSLGLTKVIVKRPVRTPLACRAGTISLFRAAGGVRTAIATNALLPLESICYSPIRLFPSFIRPKRFAQVEISLDNAEEIRHAEKDAGIIFIFSKRS